MPPELAYNKSYNTADRVSDEFSGRNGPSNTSRTALDWWLAPLLAGSTDVVLLADGDARAAVAHLRQAWTGWQDLDAPYEAAKARVLSALASHRLGDKDGATGGLIVAHDILGGQFALGPARMRKR